MLNEDVICEGNEGLISTSNKDKGVNVQVIMHYRPFSDDDVLRAKMLAVVTCNEDKQKVTVTQNMGNKQSVKTFCFDKVVCPCSKRRICMIKWLPQLLKKLLCLSLVILTFSPILHCKIYITVDVAVQCCHVLRGTKKRKKKNTSKGCFYGTEHSTM